MQDLLNGGGYLFPEMTTLGKMAYVFSSFVRPVSGGWWFVTAYVLLVLCAPIINGLVSRFSRRGFAAFLFLSWAFLYSSSYAFGFAYISLVRAFFFYVMGAFVRFHCHSHLAKRDVHFFALLCVILWGIWTGCSLISSAGIHGGAHFWQAVVKKLLGGVRTCIGTPLFVFCFFRLFDSLDIGCIPRVNDLASTTFAVYLLHDSAFGRYYIWNHLLDVSGTPFGSRFFPLFAIFAVLTVFFVCAGIDFCRQKLIAPRLAAFEDAIVRSGRKLFFDERD